MAFTAALPGAASGASSLSPDQLLARATADAARSAGVVETETASLASLSFQAQGNLGRSEGELAYQSRDAGKPTSLTTLLVGGSLYIEGDAAGLHQTTLGIAAAAASTYAGKWISVPSSYPGHDKLAAALVTSGSIAARLRATKLVLENPRAKLGSSDVVELVGRLSTSLAGAPSPLPGHSFLTEGKEPLLLLVTWDLPGIGTVSTRFSDWGQSPHLAPPVNSVPISRVIAGELPGSSPADHATETTLQTALTAALIYYETNDLSFVGAVQGHPGVPGIAAQADGAFSAVAASTASQAWHVLSVWVRSAESIELVALSPADRACFGVLQNQTRAPKPWFVAYPETASRGTFYFVEPAATDCSALTAEPPQPSGAVQYLSATSFPGG